MFEGEEPRDADQERWGLAWQPGDRDPDDHDEWGGGGGNDRRHPFRPYRPAGPSPRGVPGAASN